MKTFQDFLKKNCYFCLSGGLFIAALILRIVAVLRDYSRFGYFLNTAHDWSVLLITLSILVLFIPVFFKKRDKSVPHSLAFFVPDGKTPIFSVILGIGAFVFPLSLLLDATASAKPLTAALRIAVAVLMFIFLILFAVSHFSFGQWLLAPAVLIGSIALCLYPVYLYLEQRFPLNADEKIIEEFAFLGASVYLLCLARVDIGRMQYRFFPACSYAIVFLSLYVSIPALLFSAIRLTVLSECAATPYLFFALAVYAFFTLVRVKAETAEPLGAFDGEGSSAEENA